MVEEEEGTTVAMVEEVTVEVEGEVEGEEEEVADVSGV